MIRITSTCVLIPLIFLVQLNGSSKFHCNHLSLIWNLSKKSKHVYEIYSYLFECFWDVLTFCFCEFQRWSQQSISPSCRSSSSRQECRPWERRCLQTSCCCSHHSTKKLQLTHWPQEHCMALFIWPTLAQVMANCLTAPSHYLDQMLSDVNGLQ